MPDFDTMNLLRPNKIKEENSIGSLYVIIQKGVGQSLTIKKNKKKKCSPHDAWVASPQGKETEYLMSWLTSDLL